MVDVPEGDGLVYLTALAVESKNKNFLEGCYHLYTPHDQAFPGTVLSTGTEDCTLASTAQFPLVILRTTKCRFMSHSVKLGVWAVYHFARKFVRTQTSTQHTTLMEAPFATRLPVKRTSTELVTPPEEWMSK